MKKLISLLLVIAMMTMGASLAEGALVTYFSHAGENYNVGVIEEGNTAKLAKVIAEQTGADLFEIVPVVDYPHSYDECLEVATAEQREGARPEYVGDVENWDQYDTIFIGYPIWWGEIPNIVYTFMENHDFAGKTVVPFNTHEGSGQAHSQRDIESTLSDATVLQGLAVRGATAQNDADATAKAVSDWLSGLGM
ncbi:MAG: NAD(P)H-dependent oxidoreductase [Clostridia bacterium]|nr:NAD(P)H-dependent oxidoreductase [Clostridia bacterium]